MTLNASVIELVLELAVDTDPASGRLRADQHTVAFSGYLELMSLLEEVRRSTRAPGSASNQEES